MEEKNERRDFYKRGPTLLHFTATATATRNERAREKPAAARTRSSRRRGNKLHRLPAQTWAANLAREGWLSGRNRWQITISVLNQPSFCSFLHIRGMRAGLRSPVSAPNALQTWHFNVLFNHLERRGRPWSASYSSNLIIFMFSRQHGDQTWGVAVLFSSKSN